LSSKSGLVILTIRIAISGDSYMVTTLGHHSWPAAAGGGRSGAAFRALDWSSSALGPVAAWPPALRFAADLVLSSPQPVFACWGESFIFFHNDGCLGYGDDRIMLGRTLLAAWPGMAALLIPAFKRILVSGQGEILIEQRVTVERRQQRREIFLTFACSPLRLENGGIGGVLVSCTETTETVLARGRLQAGLDLIGDCGQQAAEACQRLCESEGRLRAIVDHAPAAIYVKDLCFNYMMGNEQFAAITGTDRRQIPGKDDYALFPAMAADRFRADDRQVLTSGTYLETEEEVRLADGLHTYFTVKFPLMDDRGNIYAIAGISTDITEIKYAAAELRQAATELSRSNEELEQFAYIVSHDLREPLRTIGGFLNLLQRRHGEQLDPHARELVTFTIDGAARLDRMITDLLEYSRIQRQQPTPGQVDLFSVWLTAVDNLYAVIEESGAHISHDELPVITGDESQLVRLWQNLMSNAIKFRGDRQPEIHIGVREQPDQWLFSVRDNGIGIPPQFADRIFQVFQRLHTQREYPGSGIGLAICKKIVERHGGRIWMKSHPGRGTTFYFTITKKPR
jgi:PAS domain S-box-containing protein